jgi:hypothetical protein
MPFLPADVRGRSKVCNRRNCVTLPGEKQQAMRERKSNSVWARQPRSFPRACKLSPSSARMTDDLSRRRVTFKPHLPSRYDVPCTAIVYLRRKYVIECCVTHNREFSVAILQNFHLYKFFLKPQWAVWCVMLVPRPQVANHWPTMFYTLSSTCCRN